MDLDAFRKSSTDRRRSNQAFLRRLRRKPPKDLDQRFHELHENAFETIDCLSCANCCKTTSPIFLPKDIDRLARRFRLRPAAFIEEYLELDKEGDYVLRQAPCPFLGADNYCSVYEDRPRACREYPHTNRKRMHQILNLTYQNTMVCPAVLQIVAELQNDLGK